MFTVSTPGFLGLLNEGFLEEAWFWGVGFGGGEGTLASADNI